MGIKFNADEVFEMAARIEINGAAFYRKAAENDPEARELLLSIADQEDQHLAIFQEMRKDLSSREKADTVFDPNDELSSYLKVIADGHVFDLSGGDPSKVLEGNESLKDIIRLALQAEKDSIAFFTAMKEWVPESMGKERIGFLIEEEMKHIKWLHDLQADR